MAAAACRPGRRQGEGRGRDENGDDAAADGGGDGRSGRFLDRPAGTGLGGQIRQFDLGRSPGEPASSEDGRGGSQGEGGRVDIQVYPSSQLGGERELLSQLRSGAIELMALSGLTLSTLVPVSAINGIGFAFKSYDEVWAAMDGDLGAYMWRPSPSGTT